MESQRSNTPNRESRGFKGPIQTIPFPGMPTILAPFLETMHSIGFKSVDDPYSGDVSTPNISEAILPLNIFSSPSRSLAAGHQIQLFIPRRSHGQTPQLATTCQTRVVLILQYDHTSECIYTLIYPTGTYRSHCR